MAKAHGGQAEFGELVPRPADVRGLCRDRHGSPPQVETRAAHWIKSGGPVRVREEDAMQRMTQWARLAALILVGIALPACAALPSAGGGGGPAANSALSGKITTDGFNCPEPNPRTPVSSKEVSLYVWSTYVPTDFMECFKLVYGVDVQYQEYSSMEEMEATLQSSPNTYDLILPTDFAVTPLIQGGKLAQLDHNRLPILSNFNRHYLNLPFDPGNRYTIPYENGTDAIMVNTAAVRNVPKSWTDLWNAEYAGRLVLTDDERAIIGMTLLTLGFDVNTTNPGELDQARRALTLLKPSIKVYDSDSPSSRLVAGEVALGVTWTGEAFLAQQQLSTVQFVYPTEGSILWQDNWALLSDAPHPDAAYAWMNYTMQGNMFWMLLTNFPYTNPNDAALAYAKGNPMKVTDVTGKSTTLGAVYDTYVKSPITNPSADVILAGHRIADVGDATQLYDQIWAEIRGGG
jgi:spermidine/putrescine-binding protein